MELYVAANKIRGAATRKPILDRREEIIKEVGKSVQQLGQIYGQVQQLGVDHDDASELVQRRKELNTNLEVARRTGERMKSIMGNNMELEK